MPGPEYPFAQQGYSVGHPESYKKAGATMEIEHLGQINVAELEETKSASA